MTVDFLAIATVASAVVAAFTTSAVVGVVVARLGAGASHSPRGRVSDN